GLRQLGPILLIGGGADDRLLLRDSRQHQTVSELAGYLGRCHRAANAAKAPRRRRGQGGAASIGTKEEIGCARGFPVVGASWDEGGSGSGDAGRSETRRRYISVG